MSTEEMVEPDVPALMAWNDRPMSEKADHPDVRVWMPRSLPYANLQTLTRGVGDGREEYLSDPERACVNLHIAGVNIGGFLDEMEQYIDAAADALKLARHYARKLGAPDRAVSVPTQEGPQ